MDLIQFLAMKLQPGPVFINGMMNSTKVVVHSKTNFGKAVQNQNVPETIDAVGQLILQDHHLAYHEIETTLGISGTNIHSIYCMNI